MVHRTNAAGNMAKKTKRVGGMKTEHGDLIAVEYRRGKPDRVLTSKDEFWFYQSKDGLLYSPTESSANDRAFNLDSGDLSKPILWIADGVTLTWFDPTTRERVPLPPKFAKRCRMLPAPLGDPFADAMQRDRVIYCRACADYMDEEQPCHHFRWLDLAMHPCGPGCDECVAHDLIDTFMLPVIELVARAGVARAFRKALVNSTSTSAAVDWLIDDAFEAMDETDYDRARAAAHWLSALDEKTTRANRLTIEWLDLVIACQNARRASGASVYAVRDGHGNKTAHRFTWPEALAEVGARRRAGQFARIVYVRKVSKRKAVACVT